MKCHKVVTEFEVLSQSLTFFVTKYTFKVCDTRKSKNKKYNNFVTEFKKIGSTL